MGWRRLQDAGLDLPRKLQRKYDGLIQRQFTAFGKRQSVCFFAYPGVGGGGGPIDDWLLEGPRRGSEDVTLGRRCRQQARGIRHVGSRLVIGASYADGGQPLDSPGDAQLVADLLGVVEALSKVCRRTRVLASDQRTSCFQ